MASKVEWSEAERRAWRWPSQLKPSEWAQANRILHGHDNAEPGPWRNERTPYLVGIMDAIHEPGAEEIVVLKAAQIGFSESIRNILGFWIDHEPGPCLVVMPDQKSAEELIQERIKPLLEFTPAVTRHLTDRAWDVKRQSIKLDTMSIYLAWAGSSQGMKSRPIRYLLLEEPDEYPAQSGAGGDPVHKAMMRVTTYAAKGRARIIIGGTPILRHGNVCKRWALCQQRRYFWVPCPHCGQYQQLVWGNVKWPDLDEPDRSKRGAAIEADDSAYYQCEHCKRPIREAAKMGMLQRGVWANEDQVVTAEGKIAGPTPARCKRIGFFISAIYSPWVRWSKLAAEFIAAKDDPHALMEFVNQRLAEPFEEQVLTPKESEYVGKVEEAKKAGVKPGLVPDWAGGIFVTVDTQQAGFWIVVRAWGYRYRSRLLWHGFVLSFDEVYDIAVNRLWPGEAGGQYRANLCLIDSGGGTAKDARESRTQEVYRFCERAPGFLLPIKGASSDQIRTVRASPYAKDAAGRPVPLYTINTNRLKDELTRLMRVPAGQDGYWELHPNVDAEYLRQMASEQKIVIDPKTGEQGWVRTGSKNNHIWDCETYQIAAADPDLGRVGTIQSAEEQGRQQETMRQRRVAIEQAASNRPTWISEVPENWMDG